MRPKEICTHHYFVLSFYSIAFMPHLLISKIYVRYVCQFVGIFYCFLSLLLDVLHCTSALNSILRLFAMKISHKFKSRHIFGSSDLIRLFEGIYLECTNKTNGTVLTPQNFKVYDFFSSPKSITEIMSHMIIE